MGVETAILVGSLAVGASKIIGGIEAKKAGKKQKKLLEGQAAVAREEAKEEAGRVRRAHKKENARFKVRVLSRGVGFEGSPVAELQSNEFFQGLETQSIIDRGEAVAGLLEQQGKQAAKNGRAQFTGGLISGIGSIVGGVGQAKSTSDLTKLQSRSSVSPAASNRYLNPGSANFESSDFN